LKLLIRKENNNFDSLVVKKILNKNFQEINNYLKLLNNHINFLILDIETSSRGEIIELGYFIIEKGEIIKKVNHLIKPKILVNNFFNNISLDHLRKAKSLEEVLQSVESDLTNKVLIGHNLIRFDFPKINQA
jgi:DNA polymerase III alpha subunit (gram-positive type)